MKFHHVVIFVLGIATGLVLSLIIMLVADQVKLSNQWKAAVADAQMKAKTMTGRTFQVVRVKNYDKSTGDNFVGVEVHLEKIATEDAHEKEEVVIFSDIVTIEHFRALSVLKPDQKVTLEYHLPAVEGSDPESKWSWIQTCWRCYLVPKI